LPVAEILRTPTYGPHWKENSLRECVEYFNSQSNDLLVVRAEYVADPRPLAANTPLAGWQRRVEDGLRFLRWGLHIEVEKRGHGAGMAIQPSW
jgi:hypothetical protein